MSYSFHPSTRLDDGVEHNLKGGVGARCGGGERLVETLGRAHGGLDVDGANVLPVLLQEGDEEVDGELDVLDELLAGEVDVADGNSDAEDLLHLELDGGLDLSDLLGDGLVVGDEGGELSGLVESRSEETRNLTEDGLRREEGIVLLSCFSCLLPSGQSSFSSFYRQLFFSFSFSFKSTKKGLAFL